MVLAQDQAQPFAPDNDAPVVAIGAQIGGEFPHAPVRERDAQSAGSGGGRRDDERDVVITDQAGTASRPLRVQRGQPPLVERVDHIANGVLSAATSRAIAATGVPELEAMMIVARRTRIELPRPRRTIWVRVRPS